MHFEAYDLPPGEYSLIVEPNNAGAFAVRVDVFLSGGWA